MNNGRRSAWPTILAVTAIITIAGTIVLIVVSLTNKITGPLEWWKAHVDNTRQLYLLSATAQVLAALFALVFSITLLAVQFVTKYTHRTMRIVFTGRVIVYMGGFALAVVLPLWFISHPTGWGSLVSVIIGSLYVLSLVGFFLYLRDRMKIDGLITYLKEEGLNAVEGKEFKKAEENIKALDNIGMGAYSDRNYEVFEMAVAALGDLALITTGQQQKDIFQKFIDTSVGTIADRRAPVKVVETLGRVGLDSVKNSHTELWQSVGVHLITIESWCSNSGRKHVSTACANALHEMISNAQPFLSTTKGTLSGCTLNDIAQFALERGLKKGTDKDLTDNNPYFFLVNKEIHIYKRHVKYAKEEVEKWDDLLLNDLAKVKELIIFVNEKACFFDDSLIRFLFEYLGLFLDRNAPEWGYQFCSAVRKIEKATKPVPGGEPSDILNLMVQLLKSYADVCMKKWAGTKWAIQWRDIGNQLLKEAEAFENLFKTI